MILAPVLLALLGLVIAAGRTSIAQGSVDAAARDAARQASIALTPAAAQAGGAGQRAGRAPQDGLDCVPPSSVEYQPVRDPARPAGVR